MMAGRVFKSADTTAHPVLAIVLHGDLLDARDSYHYRFAQTMAAQSQNTVAVGLIRPGYGDEAGQRSDGNALLATGDNYTADVVDAVADAARQLKARYDARAIVLIGHSGGAAISALMLGRHENVADAALLVACPCDVPAWRSYMNTVRPGPIWQRPHQGLSPMDFASRVNPAAIVELLVGANDQVVRTEYSEKYATLLKARGAAASVSILPGLDHNILLRPPVLEAGRALIARVQRRYPAAAQ
jgi:alpha-beta hydrolase superfamily lysophospholipase